MPYDYQLRDRARLKRGARRGALVVLALALLLILVERTRTARHESSDTRATPDDAQTMLTFESVPPLTLGRYGPGSGLDAGGVRFDGNLSAALCEGCGTWLWAENLSGALAPAARSEEKSGDQADEAANRGAGGSGSNTPSGRQGSGGGANGTGSLGHGGGAGGGGGGGGAGRASSSTTQEQAEVAAEAPLLLVSAPPAPVAQTPGDTRSVKPSRPGGGSSDRSPDGDGPSTPPGGGPSESTPSGPSVTPVAPAPPAATGPTAPGPADFRPDALPGGPEPPFGGGPAIPGLPYTPPGGALPGAAAEPPAPGDVRTVPEPGNLVLIGLGASIAAYRLRRRTPR